MVSEPSISPLFFCACVLALAVAGLGCDVDAGVDDVRYECSSSAQCGEGFECKTDPTLGREVCVPEGTTFDVSDDTGPVDAGDADGEDARDTTADATDSGADADTGGDADTDGGCVGDACPADPIAIELNVGEPFSLTPMPPTLKSHPDGGVLLGAVFNGCFTLQTGVECEDATERKLTSTSASDGVVLHLDGDGDERALHQLKGGTFIAYSPQLILTDIAPLSGGDWITGGTNWDETMEYNNVRIGAPDVPSGVSDDHHRWLVRSGDDTVDWSQRSGYAGNEYLGSLDVNGADRVASAGIFAQRYYKPPQSAGGINVKAYSDSRPGVEFAKNGLVEVWEADGAAHSAVRIQSNSDVSTGVVAISDDSEVAVFGEFEGDFDVFYDRFDTNWSGFSATPTLEEYTGKGRASTRAFLLVQPDAAEAPVALDMASPGNVDVWDARFAANGDLVAAGKYSANVDFGNGEVSASAFNSASFIARWNSGDLTLENLTTFESDYRSEAFRSLDAGPNGGDLVVGQIQGSVDYMGTNVSAIAAIDGLVAEFDENGQLIWHEIISAPGEVRMFAGATLEDGRVAAMFDAENEVDFRGLKLGEDGQTTTHIVIFEPTNP
jgi:hypothetical protein